MKELFKNKKIMITAAILIMVVAVIIIVRRNRKDKDSGNSSDGGSSSDGFSSGGSSSGGGSSLPMASFPLTPYSQAGEYSAAKGSYGQQIANLQKICSQKFGHKLQVDGKFGPKSEVAFMQCFGSPFKPPYGEEVYNGFIAKNGYGIV